MGWEDITIPSHLDSIQIHYGSTFQKLRSENNIEVYSETTSVEAMLDAFGKLNLRTIKPTNDAFR